MAQAMTAPAPTAPPVQATQGSQAKAAPSPTTPAPTPAEIRKMTLKIDGQDVEMLESDVKALAQQGKVSGKRFEEAAAMRKQAQDIIEFAKSNPKEFFAKTGMNAREWAETYLMEELKKEQMSPEQRRAAENEMKLKQYEDEKKKALEAKRQEEMARLQAHHAENYDKMFVEALTKTGLPKTPYTIKRMAELQLVNIKKKLDLGADQLAKLVREDYMAEQKSLFGAYDGDQLLEFLGPDLVKKLSKAQIAKLKAKGVKTAASGQPPKQSGAQELTWAEYKKRNRRLS